MNIVDRFPFNQQAQDLMMNAPAEATLKQLRELHLQVVLPKRDRDKAEAAHAGNPA